MKVVLAQKSGFCFGVKRAVEYAINTQKMLGKKVYTLGPLIHNNDAVVYLKKNEIFPIELDQVNQLSEGDAVIIRSHGVGIEIIEKLKVKGLVVVDATCPYVSNIQKKVKKYYELGYNIIIVGDKNHPEVIGINGWCYNKAVISKNGSDLENIKLSSKVCVVSQTTEKQLNWESTLGVIVKKCKEVIAFNTICTATENRQNEAEEISKTVDLMVVIGGKNSSNTTKLYEICKENCHNTIHIENSSELSDYIHKNNNKINNIGVTAGASTPDWVIKEAINKMIEDKNFDMNDILEYMDKNDKQIVVGKVVKGEIISVSDKEVFVNIGYKIDGIIPLKEVSKKEDVKLTDLFKIGDFIDAKVVSRRSEEGYVVLSRVELERDGSYNELKTYFKESTVINIKIKEIVNGGMIGNFKGVRVFVPASHVELFHVNSLEGYVGKDMEVKLIEFDESKRNTRIVASRRELLKIEKDKREEAAWSILEKDTIVEGEVKRLSDFGAFIEVNGVDGLLHISEMSWGRIEKPKDLLKIGTKIKVYILNLDKEKKKLSLSIKKLSENPWENVDVKYPVGNVVLGRVVRFTSFGAFLELEPGVDGLLHISEISRKRIAKPENVLQIGEVVKAKIIDVKKEEKKIGLSMKELEEIESIEETL